MNEAKLLAEGVLDALGKSQLAAVENLSADGGGLHKLLTDLATKVRDDDPIVQISAARGADGVAFCLALTKFGRVLMCQSLVRFPALWEDVNEDRSKPRPEYYGDDPRFVAWLDSFYGCRANWESETSFVLRALYAAFYAEPFNLAAVPLLATLAKPAKYPRQVLDALRDAGEITDEQRDRLMLA